MKFMALVYPINILDKDGRICMFVSLLSVFTAGVEAMEEAFASAMVDNNLLPYLILQKYSCMTGDIIIKERAVLAGVEAVQKSQDYHERAKYVKKKLDADTDTQWGCSAQHKDTLGTANAYHTVYKGNRLYFKVGSCCFRVWQSKP